MIGRDAGSISDGVLPSSRLTASSPCRRNGLVDAGKRDVFYGENDVADLMFSEEEDMVMRAYRSDDAMRSLQDMRRQGKRFFCCECFDFLRLVFSGNRN
ncbi:unnamed protein product [Eruca vesicaria subsp. sativa]|uniref:Uncharacterized protein n=1 Tax=Eruca vesicaria subsp. sativa TaxID=29727 RepID=A0ABC8LRD1_ERUVS|nr:unnamed protein product [Eruca vesicaria subsp. sativa]